MHWGAGDENESSAEAEVAVDQKKYISTYFTTFANIPFPTQPGAGKALKSIAADIGHGVGSLS